MSWCVDLFVGSLNRRRWSKLTRDQIDDIIRLETRPGLW